MQNVQTSPVHPSDGQCAMWPDETDIKETLPGNSTRSDPDNDIDMP